MGAEDEGRTEAATPRRRDEARGKGNIATSRELISLVPLWVLFTFFSFTGIAFFNTMVVFFKSSLKRSFETSLNDASLMEIFKTDAVQLGQLMLPLFGWMIVLSIVIHLYSTDFYFSTAKMKFENAGLLNLNPLNFIKRMFSKTMVFDLAKGFLKMIVLSLILYFILKKEILTLPLLVDMDILSIAGICFGQINKLILISAVVLSFFGIVDFFYQRWQFEDSLKMTKMDIKDEMKSSEGDPKVKARIRSLQRQMAMKRMMQEVPKADVVITNPTHFAVALKYDTSKMVAPKVVAKGANLVAERIKEIAKKHKVPVFEDKPLARTLFKIEIGQEIPEVLYKAVATILANVYKMKGKKVKR
ncbi:MAG: flagellar biosynthesis protein FlhB [Nitrospirae bacterium]|nr:MAG: flagellar biosynthesis protein FlhB [Nitrospirota bacterium]